MVLDFTKGKYGLQLILLFIIVLVSSLIFQILGISIINSVFNFDIYDLISDNSSQLIMENENGYWIFFVLIGLNSLGMFILSSIVFAKLISINALDYLSINSKPSFNFLIYLPIFSIAGVILVSFMGELNMKLNLPEVFHTMEQEASELINFIVSFNNPTHIVATFLLMAILPAIGEELFFRGILQKIFIKWTKKNWLGILITAFIFSAIHLQFLTFLPRFFMGIMLGYLFVWSRNLIIPIIAHLLHNFISIVVAMNTEQTEIEIAEFSNFWFVILAFVIMALISYRYYSLSRKSYV